MGYGSNCCEKSMISNTTEERKNSGVDKKLEAYNSMISLSKMINTQKILTTEVYLVILKSIKNFINCLIESNISNDLFSTRDEILKKIKESFNKCNEEDKIEIYDDYENCKLIAQNNIKEENAFIIVDKNFISCMNGNCNQKNEVTLNINKNKSDKMKIIFKDDKYLYFKRNNDYYEFIYENEQNDVKKEDEDIKQEKSDKTKIIQNSINKKKKN